MYGSLVLARITLPFTSKLLSSSRNVAETCATVPRAFTKKLWGSASTIDSLCADRNSTTVLASSAVGA